MDLPKMAADLLEEIARPREGLALHEAVLAYLEKVRDYYAKDTLTRAFFDAMGKVRHALGVGSFEDPVPEIEQLKRERDALRALGEELLS